MNKLLILGLLLPAAAGARTIEAGAGKQYAAPSAAIAEAHSGDHVVIAPGQYFDCAVVSVDGITIEGAGDAASVVLTDKTCQGKALLVIDSSHVTVRNLTLTRARVPDGNGAGIRAEGGDLTVDGVAFVNNQNGILTSDNPAATVTVLHSRFVKNGVCGDYCAHAIYVGHIRMLRVSDSIFHQTRDGHDIKSRAASTEVTGCDFADGSDGTASYAIELPNGGSLIARHNTIEKGPRSGNHTAAISIGAEGVSQPTPAIIVEDNRMTNDGAYHTALVVNVTATEAQLRGNTLTGSIDPLRGDGSAH